MSGYDPLDLRGQEQHAADEELQDRLARETENGDLKWLMSSKRGRRVIWRLLDRAGVFRLSFNTNAMSMAFSEGNRNEGLRTLMLIHTLCPELYPTMVKEANNARNRNSDDGRNGRNDP
jgi:hypothetical protein